MLTSCPPRPRTRSVQRHRDSQDSSFSDRQPLTVSKATQFGRPGRSLRRSPVALSPPACFRSAAPSSTASRAASPSSHQILACENLPEDRKWHVRSASSRTWEETDRIRPRHLTRRCAFSLWPMVAIGEMKWVSHNMILAHWVDRLGMRASKLA